MSEFHTGGCARGQIRYLLSGKPNRLSERRNTHRANGSEQSTSMI